MHSRVKEFTFVSGSVGLLLCFSALDFNQISIYLICVIMVVLNIDGILIKFRYWNCETIVCSRTLGLHWVINKSIYKLSAYHRLLKKAKTLSHVSSVNVGLQEGRICKLKMAGKKAGGPES